MTQETYDALTDEERALVDEFGMDELDDDVEFVRCSRCGALIVKGTEEHSTWAGTLCDCCYDDLYG